FQDTCDKVGEVHIPIDECKRVVDLYRFNRPRVKDLWYRTEGLFRDALEGRPNKLFQGVKIHGTPFIRAALPSGRYLYYARPSQAWEVDPKSGKSYLVIRYWGQNTYTRQWGMVKTYGGKLVENQVQAIARDIMAEGTLRLDRRDYNVVLLVHDE